MLKVLPLELNSRIKWVQLVWEWLICSVGGDSDVAWEVFSLAVFQQELKQSAWAENDWIW